MLLLVVYEKLKETLSFEGERIKNINKEKYIIQIIYFFSHLFINLFHKSLSLLTH